MSKISKKVRLSLRHNGMENKGKKKFNYLSGSCWWTEQTLIQFDSQYIYIRERVPPVVVVVEELTMCVCVCHLIYYYIEGALGLGDAGREGDEERPLAMLLHTLYCRAHTFLCRIYIYMCVCVRKTRANI